MAFLDPILSPVLQPLIDISPFWGILIMAFVITLIITLAYKFFTNQDEMKRLKDEQKEYQKQMKSMKDKPEEMMKVQKEAMKKNMEYMKHSLRATLITFIPIILIFGWMNAHLMYEPIFPGERYSVTAEFVEGIRGNAELIVDESTEILNGVEQEIQISNGNNQATWNLKSNSGTHLVTVKLGDDEQSKKVLITKDLMYEDAVSVFEHSDISKITINYNKLKPLGPTSIFGWHPGWLGIYIIASIVLSIGLRKLLKVY